MSLPCNANHLLAKLHAQVMPPPFAEAPEVVECLLYHADVEEVHGPTCIVPREPGGNDEAYDSCEP